MLKLHKNLNSFFIERKIITNFYLIDKYLRITGIKNDIDTKISNNKILLIGVYDSK